MADMTAEPSPPDDPHFVLRFMDGDDVEYELELDETQLVLLTGERRISISLSGRQFNEIKNLRTISARIMP